MSTFSRLTQSLSDFASSTPLRLWNVLRLAPGGGVLMGRLIGSVAPYTGTIRPEVLRLEEGSAQVRMQDRHTVRNHLNSVHAIALMNLGEMTTGLAVLSTLPDGMRAIITHLEMDYVKKARGPITAECHAPRPVSDERREYDIQADLTDASGEVVARARARWLIAPAMH
jgi:acyl-coenzyme A thioesterase PaaI-like protein